MSNHILAIFTSALVLAAVALFGFILDLFFGKETPCRHCQKRPGYKSYNGLCLDCHCEEHSRRLIAHCMAATLTRSANLTFTGESELDCLLQAIAYLQNHGYIVTEHSADWETPSQFCKRLGICAQTLIRKLASPHCPGRHGSAVQAVAF